MLIALKQLILVLIISATIFWLAKPVVLSFWTEEDFRRRRNTWFLLTAAAFLAPSFWLFCLIAIPTLFVAGRKDANPTALYLLLLHVIPPINITLPMIGISQLFDVNNFVLLAFFVLIPAAFRLRRDPERKGLRGLHAMDLFLIAYGVLTSILFVLPEASRGTIYDATVFNDIRHGFVFFTATYLPYFAISRSLTDRQAIKDSMVALCLSSAIMAGIALYESASTWLLYGDIADRWGYGISLTLYLVRGGAIRAAASAGHPLILGYVLSIAFGFWLFLQQGTDLVRYRIGFFALLWAGLFASFARGAWMGTALIYFVYAALSPNALSRLFRAGGIAFVAAVVVSFTPLGDRIVRYIPFLGGSTDTGSYVYRQQLVDRSWQIIEASPFLGDQDALLKMQDMRQGEGIIDLINAYVSILLDNGFLGLGLFLAFILVGLLKTIALSRRTASTDADLSRLGACLAACIIGTLLMLVDGNLGLGVERVFYVLAALAAAYAHLGQTARRTQKSQFRFRAAIKSPPTL
jgi:O-antigen ligase